MRDLTKAFQACPNGLKKAEYSFSKGSTVYSIDALHRIIDSEIDSIELHTLGFKDSKGHATVVCSGTYKDCKDSLLDYSNSHEELIGLVEGSHSETIQYECA